MKSLVIFSTTSKSPLFSNASPQLLAELIASLPLGSRHIQYTIYPIPHSFEFFSLLIKSPLYYLLLIKSLPLLRDSIFALRITHALLNLQNSLFALYNPSRFLLFFLKITLLPFNGFSKLIIIHADGAPYPKPLLRKSSRIVVFSQVLYRYYRSIAKIPSITLAYPAISSASIPQHVKNHPSELLVIHSGSIGDYNTPPAMLLKLATAASSNKKLIFVFTTSQETIPPHLSLLISRIPRSRIFKRLSHSDLRSLLQEASFFLDLRQTKNLSRSQHGDTPSKIFLYLPFSKPILSTRSLSIPREIRSNMIPITNLFSASPLTNIDLCSCSPSLKSQRFLDTSFLKWL